MKRIGIQGVCIGCGAKEVDPECNCKWITCRCGYSDCWVRADGHYHCKNCDYDSDPKSYDW